MDASDDEPSNFEDANDFFSFAGKKRDPLELNFSGTIQNLNLCPTTPIYSGNESPVESALKKLLETQMVPLVQNFLQTSEKQHTQLINTTVDFLRDIDQNQLPYSDHQAAVIEKTKQLKKLCTRLGGTQKEELFEPIKCQVKAAVENLQLVEAGIMEQISETKLRVKLMQEAILDIDKFVEHVEMEADSDHELTD